MSSIWEITRTALVGLNIPLAANRYLVPTGQQLPDQYIIYQLISSPPELSADNVRKIPILSNAGHDLGSVRPGPAA